MIYILYDTALNGLYTLNLLQKVYPDNQSLFKGTNDEVLFDVAPYVFKADAFLLKQLNDPDVSLEAIVAFESDNQVSELLLHFRQFIYQHKNGREYYFRFWDARVLARFLANSSNTELNNFFDGISNFYDLCIADETVKRYFIKRGRLQSETLPMNRLFAPANNRQEELAAIAPSADKPKKNKRTFFN